MVVKRFLSVAKPSDQGTLGVVNTSCSSSCYFCCRRTTFIYSIPFSLKCEIWKVCSKVAIFFIVPIPKYHFAEVCSRVAIHLLYTPSPSSISRGVLKSPLALEMLLFGKWEKEVNWPPFIAKLDYCLSKCDQTSL